MTATGVSIPRQQRWAKRGLVILTGLYIWYIVFSLLNRGLFEYVGIDFRTIWASAMLAHSSGFREVYDLNAQAPLQRQLYDEYAHGTLRMGFAPVPMPYLPIFVALFEPVILVSPVVGFATWVILNGAVIAFVVARITQYVQLGDWKPTIFLVALSWPVFATLFLGQVNAWLLVFVTEAMIAFDRRQDLRAGLWLGGLMLKPQLLILIVPGLLVARYFRVLGGLVATAVVFILISTALAGIDGMFRLVDLVLRYPGGMPTTFPESMMNWRALAINLSGLVTSPLAWGVSMVGLVVTTAVAISLWTRISPSGVSGVSRSELFLVQLFGTYAATCAVTWHAHVYMALPLVAFVIWLLARGTMPKRFAAAWLIVPAGAFFAAALVAYHLSHNVVGIVSLAFNLAFLGWAHVILSRTTKPTVRTATVPFQGCSISE